MDQVSAECRVRSAFSFLILALLLTACGEKPAPGPVSTKEVRIRKLVVFLHDGAVEGHFSLENEEKKQLALRGKLTLVCYLESKVNVEDKPTFNLKSEIYRGSQEVKVSDFQWIYYHSFLTEDDFVCRFRVPLDKFRSQPPVGRYFGFKLEFKADAYPSMLEGERKIWMPGS